MLATLQTLYADVPVCAKNTGGLSSTFQSIIGVKQGCPLSPVLFGIFMGEFELHVQRTVSPALAQLPQLCGSPVHPLLFADDMLLRSTSAAGLNAQLQSLQAYCDTKKQTVNAAKARVMIMPPGGGRGGRRAATEVFCYGGQRQDMVKTIKYLGLTFAQQCKAHGFTCCAWSWPRLAGAPCLPCASGLGSWELQRSSTSCSCLAYLSSLCPHTAARSGGWMSWTSLTRPLKGCTAGFAGGCWDCRRGPTLRWPWRSWGGGHCACTGAAGGPPLELYARAAGVQQTGFLGSSRSEPALKPFAPTCESVIADVQCRQLWHSVRKRRSTRAPPAPRAKSH
jgi:hypothetical protein